MRLSQSNNFEQKFKEVYDYFAMNLYDEDQNKQKLQEMRNEFQIQAQNLNEMVNFNEIEKNQNILDVFTMNKLKKLRIVNHRLQDIYQQQSNNFSQSWCGQQGKKNQNNEKGNFLKNVTYVRDNYVTSIILKQKYKVLFDQKNEQLLKIESSINKEQRIVNESQLQQHKFQRVLQNLKFELECMKNEINGINVQPYALQKLLDQIQEIEYDEQLQWIVQLVDTKQKIQNLMKNEIKLIDIFMIQNQDQLLLFYRFIIIYRTIMKKDIKNHMELLSISEVTTKLSQSDQCNQTIFKRNDSYQINQKANPQNYHCPLQKEENKTHQLNENEPSNSEQKCMCILF